MNAEQPKSQEANGKVLDFAKAKLNKGVEQNSVKATAQVLAAGVRKMRPLGPVKSRHDDLMAMPVDDRNEFLDALAQRMYNPGVVEKVWRKVKLFIPIAREKMFYEQAKDGTLTAMLMLGMIGERAEQERIAIHAEPGTIEKWFTKALPWIAKLDMEIASREFLELLALTLKAKGLVLETLKQTRHYVEIGTDAEAMNTAVEVTRGTVEDLANYAGRMPGHKDHKTPEEIDVDNAMGPESQAA